MIDKDKMEEQELKDFKTTEKIMHKIFKSYNKVAELKQNPIYSPIDACMTVDNKYKYAVEIKERFQNLEEFATLPLKVSKYCSIKENTPEDAKPLIIYLLNDEQYFIFNLEKLDLNKCAIKNWLINKIEFCDGQEKEKQPTIFIPLEQAIYNGKILKYNANN